MFKDDDEEEENTFGVTRYPCMPSLVALQQMRNRLHLAFLGRKLMKWTAMATGREMRRLAGELYELYEGFGEDMRNAFIMLARARYFCPQLNYIVTEDICKQAGVVVQQNSKSISGVKIVQFEIFETQYPPYAHLGIEKGGQAILEAKKAWLDLLKRLIMMMQLRASFLMVELANRNATKKWNVLSKMVVPRIKLSCHYILSELEEIEREDNFRLKRFKELKYKTTKGKVKPSFVKEEDEFSGSVTGDKINAEDNIADQSEVVNPLLESQSQDNQNKLASLIRIESDDKEIEFIDQREILSKANLQDSFIDKQHGKNIESNKSLQFKSSASIANSCPSCMKKGALRKSIEFIIERDMKSPLESYIFSRVRSVCANCKNWKLNEGFVNNNYIDVHWMMPDSGKDEIMNISEIEYTDQHNIKSLTDVSQIKNSERIKMKRIEFLDQRKVKSLTDLPESFKANINEGKLICPYCKNKLNSKIVLKDMRNSTSLPCPGCNNNEIIKDIDHIDQSEMKYLQDISQSSKLNELESYLCPRCSNADTIKSLTNNSEFLNVKEVYPGCKNYYMKVKSIEFIKKRNLKIPIEILPSSQVKNGEKRQCANCFNADISNSISNASDSNIQVVYPGCNKYYIKVKSDNLIDQNNLLCPTCESEELNEVNFKDSKLNNNEFICPDCQNDLLSDNSKLQNLKMVYPGCKNYYIKNKSTQYNDQPEIKSSNGTSKLLGIEDQSLCLNCKNERKDDELVKKAKFENIKMVYLGYKHNKNNLIEFSPSSVVNYSADKSLCPNCAFASKNEENDNVDFTDNKDLRSPLESFYIFSRVKGKCPNCRNWKQNDGCANDNNLKSLDIWWMMPGSKRNERTKNIRAIEFIDQREIKSLTDIAQLKKLEINNKRIEFLDERKFISLTDLTKQKKICTNWQNEIQNQILIKKITNVPSKLCPYKLCINNEEQINDIKKKIEFIDQRDSNVIIPENTVSLKLEEHASSNKSITNNLKYKNVQETFSRFKDCSMAVKKIDFIDQSNIDSSTNRMVCPGCNNVYSVKNIEFIDQRDIESPPKFAKLFKNKSIEYANLCPNCKNRTNNGANTKSSFLKNNRMTCHGCNEDYFVKNIEFIDQREVRSLTDISQFQNYEINNKRIEFLDQRKVKSLTDFTKPYKAKLCPYCQNEQQNQLLIKHSSHSIPQLCPSCNNNYMIKVKEIEFIDQRNNNLAPDTALSIYPSCKNCNDNLKRIEFIDQRDTESSNVGIICPGCKNDYLVKNVEFIDQRDFDLTTEFQNLFQNNVIKDENLCPNCGNVKINEVRDKDSYLEKTKITCHGCSNDYFVKNIEFIDQREIKSVTDISQIRNYEKIKTKRIEFLDQRKIKSLPDLPQSFKMNKTQEKSSCFNENLKQNQFTQNSIRHTAPQLCSDCNEIKKLKEIQFIDQRNMNAVPDISKNIKEVYADCKHCYMNVGRIEIIDQRHMESPIDDMVCIRCKNDNLVKNIEIIDQRDFENVKSLHPGCENCLKIKNIEFIDQREIDQLSQSSIIRASKKLKLGSFKDNNVVCCSSKTNSKTIEFIDQREVEKYLSCNTINQTAYISSNQFLRVPSCKSTSHKINPRVNSGTSDRSILQSFQNYGEGQSISDPNSIASNKNLNKSVNKDSTSLCCMAKRLHTPKQSTSENVKDLVKTIKGSITINTSPNTVKITRKEVQVTTTSSKEPIFKSSSEICAYNTKLKNLIPKITSEDNNKTLQNDLFKASKQCNSQINNLVANNNKNTFTFTNDKATQYSATTISVKSTTKNKKNKFESTSRCKIKIKTKDKYKDENNVEEEIKLTPSCIFTLRKAVSSSSKTETNKNTYNIKKTGSTDDKNSNLKIIDSKYKHPKSVLIITNDNNKSLSKEISCDLKKVIKVYEIQSHDGNCEVLKEDIKLNCKCSKNKESIENCCCNLQRYSYNNIKSFKNGCSCKPQYSDGVSSLSKSCCLVNYSEREKLSSDAVVCYESRKNLEKSRICLCSTALRYNSKTCTYDKQLLKMSCSCQFKESKSNREMNKESHKCCCKEKFTPLLVDFSVKSSISCENKLRKAYSNTLGCKSNTDFKNCDCETAYNVSDFKGCSCKFSKQFVNPQQSSESLFVGCQTCSGLASSQISQKSIKFCRSRRSLCPLRSPQSVNSKNILSKKNSKRSLCCKNSSYSFQDCLSRQTLCSCKIFDYAFMISDPASFECKKSKSNSQSDTSM